MRELQLYFVNEETGAGLTVDFCGQSNDEIKEVIEALNEIGYDLENESELDEPSEDDILAFVLADPNDWDNAVKTIENAFGSDDDPSYHDDENGDW